MISYKEALETAEKIIVKLRKENNKLKLVIGGLILCDIALFILNYFNK